jgi:tRNA 2-thiouridine synthesizing protein A
VSPPDQPVVVDGGDKACIRLLLDLRARIADLPAGILIHLIAADPAAPLDLPAWCHLTGHTYLGALHGAPVPTYALRTSARPTATDPASPWRAATPGQP